ncbi:MAG: hypothetical protein ACE3JP_02655 [Ectobacillus sp.]
MAKEKEQRYKARKIMYNFYAILCFVISIIFLMGFHWDTYWRGLSFLAAGLFFLYVSKLQSSFEAEQYQEK